jgi:hypothetical protein
MKVLELDKPRAVGGPARGEVTSRNRDYGDRATGAASWQCATMWRHRFCALSLCAPARPFASRRITSL